MIVGNGISPPSGVFTILTHVLTVILVRIVHVGTVGSQNKEYKRALLEESFRYANYRNNTIGRMTTSPPIEFATLESWKNVDSAIENGILQM